jgi:hypothetical protein
MLSMRRISFSVCAAVLATLTLAAPAAQGALHSGPEVTNLRLSSGTATQVKIAWDAPSSLPSGATVDEYIIRRDGHRIATLQGFSNLIDTSYIDGSPSSKDVTYTVRAVDSQGHRGPPASLSVPAPQGAAPAPKQDSKDSQDGIQSSNLCNSITPTSIRGHNQPTAFEKYGCGSGMNSVNDDTGSKINLGITHIDKPRPAHDFWQNFFIQFPITAMQWLFLMMSTLTTWVMQVSTYLGIATAFGGILQTFRGHPDYPALQTLALALGLVVLAFHVAGNRHREGYISTFFIVLSMAALTILLSNINHTMRSAVEKPLGVYTYISNELSGMTQESDLDSLLNMTDHPTFSGDATNTALRKSIESDFLAWQFIPQCEINFGNFRWATTHYQPGTHVTFCERYVQISGSGSDDGLDQLKSDLKKASPTVAKFFHGDDQGTRVIDTDASKFVQTEHTGLQIPLKTSVFICEMLLISEVFFAVGWLILLAIGRQAQRLTAERRMRTIFHWLAIPAVMTVMGLLVQTVETIVVTHAVDSSFGTLLARLAILDLVAIIAVVMVYRNMRNDHKDKMQQLGSTPRQSNGWGRRALGALGAGVAGGLAGASIEAAHQKKASEKPAPSNKVPTDQTFDVHDINEPGPAQLGSGSPGGGRGPSGNGNRPSGGNPSWDAEADAEEIPEKQFALTAGGSPSSDEEITDAEVVGEEKPTPRDESFDPDDWS